MVLCTSQEPPENRIAIQMKQYLELLEYHRSFGSRFQHLQFSNTRSRLHTFAMQDIYSEDKVP